MDEHAAFQAGYQRALRAGQRARSRCIGTNEALRRAREPVQLQRAAGGLVLARPIAASAAAALYAGEEDDVVDIYLSAGPHDADGGGSCDRGDYTRCGLWRVRMGLGSKVVYDVKQVARTTASAECSGGRYHVEPAVAPGDDRYAWQHHCVDIMTKDAAASIRQAAPTGSLKREEGRAANLVPTTAAGTSTPNFPNWYSDHQILYSTNNADMMGTMWWSRSWNSGTFAEGGGLGPAGVRRQDTGFNDPDTHPAPAYMAAPAPRVVTFGGPEVTLGNGNTYVEHVPRVTDHKGDFKEVFSLPQGWRTNDNDERKPECHHPAWNIEGTRILCTRYQDPEPFTGAVGDPDEGLDYEARRLYQFEFEAASGTWIPAEGDSAGEVGALIERLTAEEFNKISVDATGASLNLFPPRTSDSPSTDECGGYVWKFAEWCGSDRYVIATVYCVSSQSVQDQDADPTPLQSRVVLIDLENSATAAGYTDLISVIESWILAVAPGEYSGVFGTCQKVSQAQLLRSVSGDEEAA